MTDEDGTQRPVRKAVVRFFPLLLLGLGFLVVHQMGWHDYLSLEALRDYRGVLVDWAQNQGLAAAAAFAFLYAVVIAFSIPGGLALTLAGGFLFGTVTAGVSVVIGATLGATVIFLAVRTAFGELLRARAGPFLKKMEAGFRENELSYMLVLRLIPLFPFWLVNIVPGFLGVSLRNYVIGTFLGIIPGTFIFASVGNGIGQILDDLDTNDLSSLSRIIFEPQFILPIIGLVCIALLPMIYRRIKSRREGNGA